MKKIKEFATLCGTSAKTLRFYDKIGLLEAEYTDPENGYRYYSDGQKDKYAVITVFKEIGFTLDEIKNEILRADEEHLLEILWRQEKELRRAHEACLRQIKSHEKNIERKHALESGKIFVQRFDDDNKMLVQDGESCRTFAVTPEGMETCYEVICSLFCTPYVNLSLADIPETNEDRIILVQTLEGDIDEMISLESSNIFTDSDMAKEIKTAMFSIEVNPQTHLEDIKMVTNKLCECLFDKAVVIWGAEFDEKREEGSVKIGVIGIY